MPEVTTRREIESFNQFEWVIAYYDYESKSDKIMNWYISKEAAQVDFSRTMGAPVEWKNSPYLKLKTFLECECYVYHEGGEGFYMLRNYNLVASDLLHPDKFNAVPIRNLQLD